VVRSGIRDLSASSYSELMLLTCCSLINVLFLRKACMYNVSQQFIRVPLLHGFSRSNVSAGVPHSCVLFSICSAYADIRLLVRM
jgi:hypothetical protein